MSILHKAAGLSRYGNFKLDILILKDGARYSILFSNLLRGRKNKQRKDIIYIMCVYINVYIVYYIYFHSRKLDRLHRKSVIWWGHDSWTAIQWSIIVYKFELNSRFETRMWAVLVKICFVMLSGVIAVLRALTCKHCCPLKDRRSKIQCFWLLAFLMASSLLFYYTFETDSLYYWFVIYSLYLFVYYNNILVKKYTVLYGIRCQNY